MRYVMLLALLCAGSAFAHEGERSHERKPAAAVPVQTIAAGDVYGAEWPENAPEATSISSAAANPDAHIGKLATYRGRITQVCQKMGCWIVLVGENGEHARVAMHDHTFGVPKDAAGNAVVYGTLSEKSLSAAEIEHLKKDGAKAPAEQELQIDALSVLIENAS
jgi:hypothetical protein